MSLINLGGTLGHIIDFELLREDSVIVDGGVCAGDFIHALSARVDTSKFRIIGFEPCKTNLENMPKSIASLQAEIYGKAVVGKNSPDELTFYEFPNDPEWGNVTGLYLDSGRRSSSSPEYKVETITLEKIFELYDIPCIDYLKLDIEGTESDLVCSMSQEIANKIKQLSMEVHNDDQDMLGKTLIDLGFRTHFERGELYGYR